ncbi:MAG: VWA domain-containing protein [Rhodospirillales bacterium]|nr:VWA domain-containing protein [Rhodospirillales bacterium]
MAEDKKSRGEVTGGAKADELAAFLEKVARVPAIKTPGGRGRLIFAMDATASREPSWDRACHIQAEMFKETDALGGLEVQLVFYRGFGECKSSPFVSSPDELVRRMVAVRCLGGQTQIGRVMKHAVKETEKKRVHALVFVGDCIEEDVDKVCHHAGKLGLLGVPAFMFQEGMEPSATRAFRQIAKLTNGAYCSFDSSSAGQLRELLSAVAVYAAGGRMALEDYGKRTGGAVLQITSQVK